jgi:hypothetical protein
VTRAEELAEKVRATLTAPIEWEPAHTAEAEAALSELVADAEALAEALEHYVDDTAPGGGKIARDALARYRGEKP